MVQVVASWALLFPPWRENLSSLYSVRCSEAEKGQVCVNSVPRARELGQETSVVSVGLMLVRTEAQL